MSHKIGIIGYGNMGSWHAENITKRIDDLEVAAVFDIKEDCLKKAEANGFKVYKSIEDFWCSDIDIVLVSTPNNFHAYYSIEAMEHDKNVVCEKPVCMEMDELNRVLETAKRTNKVFTVHQNRRFDIDFAIMQEVFRDNVVGVPYFLDSRLYSNRGISGDWRSSKEAGGGCLYDWGTHLVDQAVVLMNCKPVSVYAQLKNVLFQSVDDSCRIAIKFENGVNVNIVADLWCYIKEPRWHLSGNDGTAIINEWWGSEGKIVKANIKKINWFDGCVYTPNGLSRTMWPRPVQEITELPLPVPEKEPQWEYFYQNVMDVIDGKAELFVTHEQIFRTLQIVTAAYKSADENKVIEL